MMMGKRSSADTQQEQQEKSSQGRDRKESDGKGRRGPFQSFPVNILHLLRVFQSLKGPCGSPKGISGPRGLFHLWLSHVSNSVTRPRVWATCLPSWHQTVLRGGSRPKTWWAHFMAALCSLHPLAGQDLSSHFWAWCQCLSLKNSRADYNDVLQRKQGRERDVGWDYNSQHFRSRPVLVAKV